MPARKKNAATRLMAAFTGLRATTTPAADAMSGTAKIQKTHFSATSLMGGSFSRSLVAPFLEASSRLHAADDRLARLLRLAPGVLAERAAALLHVAVELGAELLDEALHRHRRRVAQGADGLAADAVRHLHELVHVAPRRVAVLDALEHALHPRRALAAGRALAAALVGVELGDARERADHARRVVHDDDAARAGHGAGGLQGVELHRDVDLVGGQDRRRAAAWDDRLHGPAAHDPAAVLHDELLQVVVHRLLVDARPVHVAGDAEEPGAARLAHPERREGRAAVEGDPRDVGDGL